MKRLSALERGQALIIITLAMIGMIGMTGLAIDGGNAFSDRRHAQNAADTAALAGAIAKIQTFRAGQPEDVVKSAMELAALKRAEENGYFSNLTTITVEVKDPPISGTYSVCSSTLSFDCNNYVQVIITSVVPTFFARVLGIPQITNRVEAVALADTSTKKSLYDGSAIVSLAPDCSNPGNLLVGGSGMIDVNGGGIFVNSNDTTCGFTQQGCNITLDDAGSTGITTAGGAISLNTGGSSSCSLNVGTSQSAAQLPWPPPAPFDEPTECIGPAGTWTSNSSTQHTYLQPGLYNEFPPNDHTVQSNIVMSPGVYCVNSFVKITDTHLNLTGDGVMIYIRPGYYFSLSGGTFNIKASANTGSIYDGYLIYVAPNYAGSPQNCKIDGNASDMFQGAIVAPYCNVTINGTSSATTYNSQVVGYTVKINGNSTMNFNYNPDQNPTEPKDPQTGLMH